MPVRHAEFLCIGGSDEIHTVVLTVRSERKGEVAEDVEVLLTAKAKRFIGVGEASILDYRRLRWHEPGDDGFATQMRVAPGIARPVELLKIGPPRALYKLLGRPPAGNNLGLASAMFVVMPSSPAEGALSATAPPFLSVVHSQWTLRLDVTASNIDTMTYEVNLVVRTEWTNKWDDSAGDLAQQAPAALALRPGPGSLADADKMQSRVKLDWSDLRRL